MANVKSTKAWKTDLKPPKVPPKMVNCFRCKKEFDVKWVPPLKRYSKKNSWAYWTEETEGDKQICDNCLIHFFKNEKPLYWEKVKDPKKRSRLSNYISNEDIRAS